MRSPLDDPLSPECIVVQGRGMERWLSMQLADRLGAWANPAFPFPRRAIARMLDAFPAAAETGKTGETSETGNTGAALALLSRGAAPNAIDAEKGNTALMLAANRGYLDLVQLLLAHGAKVDIVALDGWTALQAAEMIGDEETAALLRQAGARE